MDAMMQNTAENHELQAPPLEKAYSRDAINQPSGASISLVLPAFNEQETISQAIAEADIALSALTDDYEILVVDDGSSDATAELVQHESKLYRQVRLLRQPQNFGYGAALSRGFTESTKELVVFTDADCQFDLTELDRMVSLSQHYDIVCGYRINRQDPWIRKAYSAGYNLIVRLLLGTGVRDCDCAMKVFRREVIQNITIKSKGFFVNSEILTKAKLQKRSIVEVGVSHRPRLDGHSSVSAHHIPPVACSIARYWWTVILFPKTPADTASQSPAWSSSRQWGALLLLLIVCCALMLPRLSYPLIEPDETRYVQIALEMIESGNWITPTLDGEPYLDKPPLLYWSTAASLSIFGHSEAAARLPAVLSMILTTMSTFWLGRRLVGDRAAWCGALTLLLCGGFVFAGRFLLTDAMLTACITVCLLCAHQAVAGSNLNGKWWLAAGVACSLGVLAKGPVAIVICLPILIVFSWLTQCSGRPRLRHWAAIAMVVGLISLPWYAAILTSNSQFGGYFFWKHNIVRFASGMNHQQPFWYYIPVLLIGTLPSSFLIPPLTVFLFSHSEAKRRFRSEPMGFLVIAVIWILAFFSISSCKLPTYILPAIPMLCLLIGTMIDHCVLKPELKNSITIYLRPFPQRANLLVLAACAIAAVVQMFITSSDKTIPLLFIGLCCVLAMATIVIRNRAQTTVGVRWSTTGMVGLLMMSFVLAEFIPAVATQRSMLGCARTLAQQDTQRPIVYFGVDTHASSLYFPNRNILNFAVDQPDDFVEFMSRHPNAIVVTHRSMIQKARQSIIATTELIAAGGRERVYLAQPSSVPANNRIANNRKQASAY